jgi:hypothetical protein
MAHGTTFLSANPAPSPRNVLKPNRTRCGFRDYADVFVVRETDGKIGESRFSFRGRIEYLARIWEGMSPTVPRRWIDVTYAAYGRSRPFEKLLSMAIKA